MIRAMRLTNDPRRRGPMPSMPMAEVNTTNENLARLKDRIAPRRHEREAKPTIRPQHIRKPEMSM